jgi:hypothetical protein
LRSSAQPRGGSSVSVPVNASVLFFSVNGVLLHAHSCASGNKSCQLANRQTCLGVAATRCLTGPSRVIRSRRSADTGTGESTHREPSASFTMLIRVVNMIPMSRTFGPSTIQTPSANSRNSDTSLSLRHSSKVVLTQFNLWCLPRPPIVIRHN